MVENKKGQEGLADGTEAEVEKPKGRVLLVDDRELDLRFMQMILRKLGQDRVFENETAMEVGEAKEKIEGGYGPRLIISDLDDAEGDRV